jgi:hypothetical protein
MTKKQTKKVLVMATLLILMSSVAYATLTPNAKAAEMNLSEKGLSILNNVVGLDTAKYSIAVKDQQSQTDPQLGISKEYAGYNLTSDGSNLSMLCTFTNENLLMLNVFKNEGLPSLNKQAATGNAVELAQGFLSNYQTYTKNTLFGELKSTLNNIDANKNLTTIINDTRLEVSSINGYTTFKWIYSFDNILAPAKFIALGFNNGFLTYFVDNWQLYKIGSTKIALSEKEAATIALETTKTCSWSLKLDDDAFEIKYFNESNVIWSTLFFDSSLEANKARNDDALVLYPVWRCGVALDKWYGNLYGLEVDIWADTKEIKQTQEAWSTITPEEERTILDMLKANASTAQTPDKGPTVTGIQLNSLTWIAFPVLAVAIVGATLLWVRKKKNVLSYSSMKLRAIKTCIALLCVLMISMPVVMCISTANATGGAVIWGSESTGAFDEIYGYSWRKHPTEVQLQQTVSSTVRTYFANNGYGTAWNHQGNSSSKTQILSDISALQNSYNKVAVVDFDHGVGLSPGYPTLLTPPNEFHYMFEDNTGTIIGNRTHHYTDPSHGVYDMDVYSTLTTPNKISFAFINTCLSADLSYQAWLTGSWPPYPDRARGMAFAFTHRLVGSQMSSDGYNSPDSSDQCYIGFPWGSASLMQHIPYDTGVQYRWWVTYFFYYALNFDMSVKDALDTVCSQYWGTTFGNSPLSASTGGFTAYWWNGNPETMPNSSMAIYGDAYNLHLRNP